MTHGSVQRGTRRETFSSIAVIAAPAALAVALCAYQLSTRNLWLDEAASVTIAGQHGAALGSALAHDGGNMLGYYAALHVLVGWFGTGSVVIRLPSVLGTGAAVALLGLLALRLFGRRTALLAGLLSAVSLTMIYWGQNARAYTLMIALICGSFLAFVSGLERPGAWRPWVAYVLTTTAAVYLGLEAVLVVPAQLLILPWHRSRARAALVSVGAVAVCCVPLAVLAANRGSGQLFWVPAPSFQSLRHVVESLASSGLEPSFYTGSGSALLFLTLSLMLAAAVRVGLAWRSARSRVAAWPGTLALAWLLVPFLLTLIISALGRSIFQARYVLVSLPAVALLAAWVIDGAWRAGVVRRSAGAPDAKARRRPALAGAAVALLVALLALRALQVAPSYGKSSEPWRAATRYVVDRSRPGDCLAFYPLDARMPFRYYLPAGQPVPTGVLPRLPWSRARPFVEQYVVPSGPSLVSTVNGCSRLWLVSSHGGEANGPPASQANYRRYFALLDSLARRYPSLQGASFGYAGIISVTLLSE